MLLLISSLLLYKCFFVLVLPLLLLLLSLLSLLLQECIPASTRGEGSLGQHSGSTSLMPDEWMSLKFIEHGAQGPHHSNHKSTLSRVGSLPGWSAITRDWHPKLRLFIWSTTVLACGRSVPPRLRLFIWSTTVLAWPPSLDDECEWAVSQSWRSLCTSSWLEYPNGWLCLTRSKWSICCRRTPTTSVKSKGVQYILVLRSSLGQTSRSCDTRTSINSFSVGPDVCLQPGNYACTWF